MKEEKPISSLRAVRNLGGRPIRSVAAEAGISVGYLSNIERGAKSPPRDVAIRIAAALGTTYAELFQDEEVKP